MRVLIYKTCYSESTGNGRALYWDTSSRQQVALDVPEGTYCSPYNLGANVLLDSWCEGTTKMEAFTVWSGAGRPPSTGYAIKQTPNASTCAVSNDCGLYIKDIKWEETGLNIFKITITPSALGDFEYSLNNFVDVQTSNVFEDLTPGTYTAYIRSL
jgi:hypothetical protein